MSIKDRQAPENGLARRFLVLGASQKGGFFMNQRPQGLKADKAITGFLQYKSAEGLVPVTV